MTTRSGVALAYRYGDPSEGPVSPVTEHSLMLRDKLRGQQAAVNPSASPSDASSLRHYSAAEQSARPELDANGTVVSREFLAQLEATHHGAAQADHRESRRAYLEKLKRSLQRAENGTVVEAFSEVAKIRAAIELERQPPPESPTAQRRRDLLKRRDQVVAVIRSNGYAFNEEVLPAGTAGCARRGPGDDDDDNGAVVSPTTSL